MQESLETQVVFSSKLGGIVQVGNRVDPCEEDNGPSDDYRIISFTVSGSRSLETYACGR